MVRRFRVVSTRLTGYSLAPDYDMAMLRSQILTVVYQQQRGTLDGVFGQLGLEDSGIATATHHQLILKSSYLELMKPHYPKRKGD